DQKIYKLDKQIALLSLYVKISNREIPNMQHIQTPKLYKTKNSDVQILKEHSKVYNYPFRERDM
ncbi:MAG: hypothetical protein LGB72_03630, partial [Sulfurovum sp.]|nr:hypothetical protein [Sulfurovum sp.]